MVIWSSPAKKDLKGIFEYIAQDSRYYARRVIKNIVLKSLELDFLPNKGRVVPENENPNIRELFIYSYRLMYEIYAENVNVLAVIHGKRDFDPDDL